MAAFGNFCPKNIQKQYQRLRFASNTFWTKIPQNIHCAKARAHEEIILNRALIDLTGVRDITQWLLLGIFVQ
jgi:hypothetical protein